MPSFDIGFIVINLIAILIALTIHEFSHATSAYVLGDPTPRYQGRVSLNPVRHLDPTGTIMLFISSIFGFGFGWGKPVGINPANMRKVSPKAGWAISSAAGPLSNLILAGILIFALRLFAEPALQGLSLGMQIGIIEFIGRVAVINVFLALFNLIPIPPLDGFHVIQGIVPHRQAAMMAQLEQYGPFILLLLVFAGMNYVGPILAAGASTILGFFLTVGA